MTVPEVLAPGDPGDSGGDAVQVMVVLESVDPAEADYRSSVTVGDRPPVTARFGPPAPGWDQTYEGAQTSQDGAAIGSAVDIGTRLFDGLFSGDLRRCWARTVEESRGSAIRLVINTDSLAVHALPWELLYDPVLLRHHLALVDRWSLTRTVPGQPSAPDPVSGVAALSVLVVTSRTGATDVESDFEILNEAWPRAAVRLCRAGSAADIASALAGGPVDVLHIASSGFERQNDRQYIRLGDPNSTDPMAVPVFVSGTELLDLIRETSRLRMIVLAGTETEVIAAELAAEIPVVVGLRSAVSDVELDPFLRMFYPTLGRGETVEYAMSAGRTHQRTVTSGLGADWAAPVGYFAAGERIVAPRDTAKPAVVGTAAANRPSVVRTSDPTLDRAGLQRQMNRLNLLALRARWEPTGRSFWPALVTRRLEALTRTSRQAETVPVNLAQARAESLALAGAARPDPRASGPLLSRGVRACQLLDQRRDGAANLTTLIGQLAEPGFLTVAGERWLLDRLNALLAAARAEVARLVDGTAVDLATVERLEEPLTALEWSVVADTLADLERLCREQDETVRDLKEDLDTHRLWFDHYRRELDLAIRAGVPVDARDRQLLTEFGALVRAADDAEKQRDFGTVAVVSAKIQASLEQRKLWDATPFEEYIGQITAHRLAAEDNQPVIAHRSELILIQAQPGDRPSKPHAASIEYGVLLRRPSHEAAQESNLHQTMTISADDRHTFLAALDDIATAATAGVRDASDRSLAPATGGVPTRGIRPVPAARYRGLDGELTRVGKLMYNLLVPSGMQGLLRESRRYPLTVSSNDLELPWELMHDGTDFLCIKRPFARMPVGKTYPRQKAWTPPSRTAWNMLLIHSDPYDNLGDSRAEITEIERIFDRIPQVNATVLRDDQAVGKELTRHLSHGRYDLIHYAGHAGFDRRRPENSFLLLADEEKYPADKIQKVLAGRPVVFLNACYSSRANNEDESAPPDGLTVQAQGLASAFIYGGAQACVGALWPIFDDSARAFAVAFYTALLARQPVGEALRAAREFSRNHDTDRLTWAAYALYGDPRDKLREKSRPEHIPATVDPREVGRTGSGPGR